MSELITSANIDLVIKKNNEIRDEVLEQTMKLQMNPAIMKAASRPQLALLILQGFGLIQMPIEDKFWSGAIFVKNGKIIPVLNTALPRANQYFTAWHEIYHLIFDKVSFDHFIERDNTMEERKAECFAASMLLTGVDRCFIELPEMDFVSKIFHCMSAFQAPYKAVLVSLYEYAVQSENETLAKRVKEVFDLDIHLAGGWRLKARARDAHLHVAVHAAGEDVFHEQGMNVLDGGLVQRAALRHTLLYIGERFVVVCHLIDLPQGLAAHRQAVLQDGLGLDEGQRVPLNGGGVVGVLNVKAALQFLLGHLGDGIPHSGKLFSFLKKAVKIHGCHLGSFLKIYHGRVEIASSSRSHPHG